jgi:hypothetical protein
LITTSAGVPVLSDAVNALDPSLGNAAIALLCAELATPILVPLTALCTPTALAALEGKLSDWNLDAEGLNKRIEAFEKNTAK